MIYTLNSPRYQSFLSKPGSNKDYSSSPRTAFDSSSFLYLLAQAKAHFRSNPDRAFALFSQARGMAETNPDLPKVVIADIDVSLGGLLRIKGRLREAREKLEAALTLWESAVGDRGLQLARPLIALGNVCLEESDPVSALEYFGRAAEIHRFALGDESLLLANVLIRIGSTLIKFSQGQHSRFEETHRGEKLLREAYQIFVFSAEDMDADCERALDYLLSITGDSGAHGCLMAKLLALKRRLYGVGHPDVRRMEELLKAGRNVARVFEISMLAEVYLSYIDNMTLYPQILESDDPIPRLPDIGSEELLRAILGTDDQYLVNVDRSALKSAFSLDLVAEKILFLTAHDLRQAVREDKPLAVWQAGEPRPSLVQAHSDSIIIFVSHRWETKKHPDPTGRQARVLASTLSFFVAAAAAVYLFLNDPDLRRHVNARRIRRHLGFFLRRDYCGRKFILQFCEEFASAGAAPLKYFKKILMRSHNLDTFIVSALSDFGWWDRSPLARVLLWYDAAVLPQGSGKRNMEEDLYFRRVLLLINKIVMNSLSITILADFSEELAIIEDYLQRGWCFVELFYSLYSCKLCLINIDSADFSGFNKAIDSAHCLREMFDHTISELNRMRGQAVVTEENLLTAKLRCSQEKDLSLLCGFVNALFPFSREMLGCNSVSRFISDSTGLPVTFGSINIRSGNGLITMELL